MKLTKVNHNRVSADKWADTPRRMLTILIGLPPILAIIYLGAPFFNVGVGVVAFFAALELQYTIEPKSPPLIPLLLVMGCLLLASFSLLYLLPLLLVAALFIGLLKILLEGQHRRVYFLHHIIPLVIGAAYIGGSLALLIRVRDMPGGFWWVSFFFAVNWMTDSFALVGGRLIGRHKLAAEISPGKTVEGAAVGMLCGVAAGLLVAYFGDLPLLLCFVMCFVIATMTTLGDLMESAFKRHYQIKDASSFLPGHGGFLDRIDGLLLAIIPLYMALIILY